MKSYRDTIPPHQLVPLCLPMRRYSVYSSPRWVHIDYHAHILDACTLFDLFSSSGHISSRATATTFSVKGCGELALVGLRFVQHMTVGVKVVNCPTL
jgi:hypothetical protein